MFLSVLLIFLLMVAPEGVALEYLSDGELELLDGYTSNKLVEEIDDEGDLVFRRVDSVQAFKCRYGQSEANEDSRLQCEGTFENIHDQMLADSFGRYLEQALAYMEADAEFDKPGDNTQVIDLVARLDGYDYEHRMCDGMPDKGVIRFEGITFQGVKGREFRFGPVISSIEEEYDENTGRTKKIITSETNIEGIIGVRDIRVGMASHDARRAESLGGIYVDIGSGSKARISYKED